jgi:hypothetical protein
MLKHTLHARQAGTGQVPATVPASSLPLNRVHAGQTECGKASQDADMFPHSLFRHGEGLIPLRGPGRGVPVAAGLLLVPCAGQASPAAASRVAIYAAVLVAVLAAALLAVRYVRDIVVRRQMARRVTYDLLPSTSFDPSAEDVARFAYQLARTRPAVAWLHPRRSASIRIRLHTDDEGRLCYQVGGPSSAGSVLRHQSYPQVELRDADREASCPPRTDDPAGDRGEDS